MKKMSFLGVIFTCLLFSGIALAAPKDKNNNPGTPSVINLDQYVSTYSLRTYSGKGSGGDQVINITKNQIDDSSSTTTWHYIKSDGSESKEVVSSIHNEFGKFYAGYNFYQLDPDSSEFILTSSIENTPPVKIWPKGQIEPYQTWGGVYSIVYKDADGNIVNSKNEWREYRFCGYEDVTVPYGTFKNALKIRRLRLEGGLSNYWYVPEIGMIKSENIWRNSGYMEIYELVSASY